MIHCIGFLARAGHGKSAAAKYLVENYDAKIVSLAGPLKRVAKAVMKFSDEQLYGTQDQKEAMDPRYGFSSRYFLRALGTEGLRDEFWPSVHLEAFQKSLERDDASIDFDRLYGCDDVRFLNEAEFLGAPTPLVPRDMHSAVIKLVCTDAPEPTGEHPSETQIDLVPPENIAATVVSSRAQGISHLCSEIDRVIAETPRLAPFRRLLREGAARLKGTK